MIPKTRNPIGIFFLAFITGGIYYFHWYYSVNSEAAALSHDDRAKPGLSLLAVTLGWLLIVPPFVSHWRTARRVAEATGKPAGTLAMVLLAAIPLWGVTYSWWLQGKLNGYARMHALAPPASLQSWTTG